MLYIIFSLDKPHAQPLRDATRTAHIDYLNGFRDIIVLGGGLLNDDGQGHRGSAIIVNVKTRRQAEDFALNEPFKLAGLYQQQTIVRMRKGYWNPAAAPVTAQDD